MKIILFLFVATGCISGGLRQYGDGDYVESSPLHLNEGLNEWDSASLMDTALRGLQERCGGALSRLSMLARFDNQTTEMLDVSMLSREMLDKMQNLGFKISDKSSRPDIHDEFQWVDSGYVRKDTAPVIGNVEPVRNLIRSVIASRSQADGQQKYTYYRFSAQVVDAETGVVTCSSDADIRKKFRRVERSL